MSAASKADEAARYGLLQVLNETPIEPQDGSLPSEANDGRTLSVKREKQLADDFAYISATVSDNERITAVCIEEHRSGLGMNLCISSNTDFPAGLEEGFRSLATLLQRATKRSDTRNVWRDTIFKHILDMDLLRILTRLRSKHAPRGHKTSGKPTMTSLLRRTVDLLLKENQLTEEINASVNKLEKHFNTIESTSLKTSRDILIPIVGLLIEQAHIMHTTSELFTLLQHSRAIEPTVKEYLPLVFEKLSRYYTVSHDLVNAARGDCRLIFQDVRVAAVRAGHEQQFTKTDVLAAAQRLVKEKLPIARSAQRTACSELVQKVRSSDAFHKTHAELQLLLHCDTNMTGYRPRFLGASKGACYFCYLFISLHPSFEVCRTHGRIYRKWILPTWPIDNETPEKLIYEKTVIRFRDVIDKSINAALKGPRRKVRHPNESTVALTYQWPSISTLLSGAPEATNGQPNTISDSQESTPRASSQHPNKQKYSNEADEDVYVLQHHSSEVRKSLNKGLHVQAAGVFFHFEAQEEDLADSSMDLSICCQLRGLQKLKGVEKTASAVVELSDIDEAGLTLAEGAVLSDKPILCRYGEHVLQFKFEVSSSNATN